jgi:D-serine deaminase-like pyridoxal phosphate-dependent protein
MKKSYSDLKKIFSGLTHPLLFVDEDALNSNMAWVLSQTKEKKIRIATKSVRSVEVLKKILASSPRFQGLMTFTLEESLWLAQLGFADILLGYPTVDLAALEKLAKVPQDITLMVDRTEHLDMLEKIAAAHNSQFSICVDLDLSMDLPGLRFGVFRSSLQTELALTAFLNHLKKCPHLKLTAAMGYEAQIAGVGDKRAPLIQTLKRFSIPQLQDRRKKLVGIIRKHGFDIRVVNGGGTGSLNSTSTEEVVTEVTAGSAFFAPTLFDRYRDFQLSPAMGFTLPVVRLPNDSMVTVLGGGYIASGQAGVAKYPQPFLPHGLSLHVNEGAGEVQTPLYNKSGEKLSIGDFVVMRHAKAGEVCERFNEIFVITGNEISTVKTYRGEGKCFL